MAQDPISAQLKAISPCYSDAIGVPDPIPVPKLLSASPSWTSNLNSYLAFYLMITGLHRSCLSARQLYAVLVGGAPLLPITPGKQQCSWCSLALSVNTGLPANLMCIPTPHLLPALLQVWACLFSSLSWCTGGQVSGMADREQEEHPLAIWRSRTSIPGASQPLML